ncbi:transmembrane protein 180-like [Amphiura filiformis]|uniref:transmembrane protein 180-like n=1 Tax=Amphiura filiformis TaxID=82378 RepID=UPI003B210A54
MDEYIHKNAVAYSTLLFSFGLMTSIFNFYYVKLFLSVYGISQYWFNIAQLIYLLWNAINDPLFAYWQDNCKIEIFRTREDGHFVWRTIFVVSFLLAWFPWGDYNETKWLAGVHLFVSMACYDALYTFILLAHCALYAEISPKHEDRLRLTKYSQVAGMLGSSSVILAEFLCDGLENMRAFQIYVLILGVLGWAGMYYTATNVRTAHDLKSASIPQYLPKSDASSDPTATSIFTQFMQVIRRKNFILFVTINFLQIFHNYYLHNFLSIFADELIPSRAMPKLVKKLLYGGSNLLVPVLVLCLSPLVAKRGYYKVLLWSFYFKVGTAALMFIFGYEWHWLLVLFFLCDRSLHKAIFNFFNLAVSDIIDEDQREYRRSHPLSSSVFGYNALFTKPAQSLAPMMIVAILEANNYQDRLAEDMSVAQHEALKAAIFSVACAIPFVVGVLQVIVWRPYSIRDSHRDDNKMY